MKSIFARMACLALGLAVFELLPGCASSGDRGAPGDQLNPKLGGKANYTGFKSGPNVVFSVRVRQTEPMIIRPHTWTVRAWMSESNSPAVSADRAAWIKAEPCDACMPDVRPATEKVDLRFWNIGKSFSAKYTVVVIEVIEMTGGDRPGVYATKTYAQAFENGVQVPRRIDIPLVTDEDTHMQTAALDAILEAHGSPNEER